MAKATRDAATGAGLDRLAADVSARLLEAPAQLDDAARQLEQYFAGRRTRFELPLDLRLAQGFRRTVLEHLRDIGYGRTATYATVAAAAGSPASQERARRLRAQEGRTVIPE